MFCAKCGTQLPDIAVYCLMCGKPTREDAHPRPSVYFFDLESVQNGRRLVGRTNHEYVAERMYSDLERLVSRKNSIERSQEEDGWTITYTAVPEGYDDLQMGRYVRYWRDYCGRNGWKEQHVPGHAVGDLGFRFELKT